MDSNCNRGNPDIPDTGDIYVSDKGEVLPLTIEDHMENYGDVESDDVWPDMDAPSGRVIHIPAVSSGSV